MRVELDNIGKRYRLEWVLRGLSATFQEGTKHAITGPNGSGKSTLLRMLSGHLTPSKGRIAFFQKEKKIDVGDVYTYMAYAAPYIDLIEEFTLSEAIRFHRRFSPLQLGLDDNAILDILALPKASHKQIRYFSSGMKQRLKLALSICSASDILLLDEPTSNLDAQGINWYRNLVHQFGNDRLVIIASNSEIDFDFCEQRLSILDYKSKR